MRSWTTTVRGICAMFGNRCRYLHHLQLLSVNLSLISAIIILIFVIANNQVEAVRLSESSPSSIHLSRKHDNLGVSQKFWENHGSNFGYRLHYLKRRKKSNDLEAANDVEDEEDSSRHILKESDYPEVERSARTNRHRFSEPHFLSRVTTIQRWQEQVTATPPRKLKFSQLNLSLPPRIRNRSKSVPSILPDLQDSRECSNGICLKNDHNISINVPPKKTPQKRQSSPLLLVGSNATGNGNLKSRYQQQSTEIESSKLHNRMRILGPEVHQPLSLLGPSSIQGYQSGYSSQDFQVPDDWSVPTFTGGAALTDFIQPADDTAPQNAHIYENVQNNTKIEQTLTYHDNRQKPCESDDICNVQQIIPLTPQNTAFGAYNSLPIPPTHVISFAHIPKPKLSTGSNQFDHRMQLIVSAVRKTRENVFGEILPSESITNQESASIDAYPPIELTPTDDELPELFGETASKNHDNIRGRIPAPPATAPIPGYFDEKNEADSTTEHDRDFGFTHGATSIVRTTSSRTNIKSYPETSRRHTRPAPTAPPLAITTTSVLRPKLNYLPQSLTYTPQQPERTTQTLPVIHITSKLETVYTVQLQSSNYVTPSLPSSETSTKTTNTSSVTFPYVVQQPSAEKEQTFSTEFIVSPPSAQPEATVTNKTPSYGDVDTTVNLTSTIKCEQQKSTVPDEPVGYERPSTDGASYELAHTITSTEGITPFPSYRTTIMVSPPEMEPPYSPKQPLVKSAIKNLSTPQTSRLPSARSLEMTQIPSTLLHTRPPPTKMVPNRLRGKAHVMCEENGLKFQITTLFPFTGQIFTQSRKSIPQCSFIFREATTVVNIMLPYDKCGIRNIGKQRAETQYHMQIIVLFQQKDNTTTVQSFLAQCIHQKVQYQKQTIPKRIEEALEELHLIPAKLEQKAPVPECVMRIVTEEEHGHGDDDGTEVNEVDLGQPMRIEWSLVPESDAYGFHVRNCTVLDMISGAEYLVIDERGCSTDINIFGHPHYDTYHDIARVHWHAFKVPDSSQLSIKCFMKVCVDIPDSNSDLSSCDSIPSPPFCPDLITSPTNALLFDQETNVIRKRREQNLWHQHVHTDICFGDQKDEYCNSANYRADYERHINILATSKHYCLSRLWLSIWTALSAWTMLLAIGLYGYCRCFRQKHVTEPNLATNARTTIKVT